MNPFDEKESNRIAHVIDIRAMEMSSQTGSNTHPPKMYNIAPVTVNGLLLLQSRLQIKDTNKRLAVELYSVLNNETNVVYTYPY